MSRQSILLIEGESLLLHASSIELEQQTRVIDGYIDVIAVDNHVLPCITQALLVLHLIYISDEAAILVRGIEGNAGIVLFERAFVENKDARSGQREFGAVIIGLRIVVFATRGECQRDGKHAPYTEKRLFDFHFCLVLLGLVLQNV